MSKPDRNSELSAVMERRLELLSRITSQRGQVAELGARLESPLALGDRIAAVARFVRSHPLLIAGATAALVARRRGLIGTIGVGLGLWRRYRYLAVMGRKVASFLDADKTAGVKRF